MDLNALLRNAVDSGATDVHLKIEMPPVIRSDGSLKSLEGHQALSEDDLETILITVTATNAAKLQSFRETGELDTAYMSPDLTRFRVNGFRQRGATSFAFRVIPKVVPSFKDLRL